MQRSYNKMEGSWARLLGWCAATTASPPPKTVVVGEKQVETAKLLHEASLIVEDMAVRHQAVYVAVINITAMIGAGTLLLPRSSTGHVTGCRSQRLVTRRESRARLKEH